MIWDWELKNVSMPQVFIYGVTIGFSREKSEGESLRDARKEEE